MDYFRGAAQSSYSFVNNQVHQRLVQLCIFAAILFWFLGSYDLIGDVQKLLNKVGLKFGKRFNKSRPCSNLWFPIIRN